jgi:hypothetical protein
MEDYFCAMWHAVDLVGMVRSTFLVWAALLGTQTARLYSVDSPSTRKHSQKKGQPVFWTYNWTHPELQWRIHFELYLSEDMEEQLATIGGWIEEAIEAVMPGVRELYCHLLWIMKESIYFDRRQELVVITRYLASACYCHQELGGNWPPNISSPIRFDLRPLNYHSRNTSNWLLLLATLAERGVLHPNWILPIRYIDDNTRRYRLRPAVPNRHKIGNTLDCRYRKLVDSRIGIFGVDHDGNTSFLDPDDT